MLHSTHSSLLRGLREEERGRKIEVAGQRAKRERVNRGERKNSREDLEKEERKGEEDDSGEQ